MVIHGRPMVRDWDALQRNRGELIVAAPHPAPSVPGRAARSDEIPQAASRLLMAVRPPWTASCTYARGTYPGTRTGEVESIVVRLRAPGVRGWAAWLRKTGAKKPAWSFETAQVAGKGGCRTLGAVEVTEMVKGSGSDDPQ
jgi:hypothetical protein